MATTDNAQSLIGTGIKKERVCSYSNPADGPLRGQTETPCKELHLEAVDELILDERVVEYISVLCTDPYVLAPFPKGE